ncbi:hypothetical protein DOM22_04545 [Bdellovibrio sp. ZAP7]|uniref:hypothetical protein n=1 Tax=Bdellovibrio sp. ZAP7 TaxID=2231053 RepID=UPI0011582777|nr:hypothetical protein [Bdellovibrio sp. ZAP7]QDK44477.1 hypothetical protein DOM22_04545 [Bdellovibrio sp. ZAP7]
MKNCVYLFLSLTVAMILGSCAHEDEQKPQDLATDHFEVSQQGGDDKLVRSSGVNGITEQVVLNGMLKVRGVNQKYMNGVVVHLIDRDATIYARGRAASDGSFQLSGHIPKGFYLIKVIDRRFKGELPVHLNGIELKNLTVPVQTVIR